MAAKAVATKTTASKSFIDFKSVIFWVLAIVFFCYANSLTNGYNMDDEIVTINHPLTSKGLSAIPDILKSPYFQSDIYSYEYRPIVHISFAIEHQFLGESPFVSHLINLLLYLLLIYLAFDLLKRLFPAVNQTIIAAIVLVFALHPTHTEVVASIKNRDEILALLFSFLAWREAIKFTTTKQWWRILLVVLLFNLAMGSKVTVIPMVFVIPLSIWLLLDTINIKVILLSLLLGVSGVIWFQQLDLSLQIKFVGLNVALFLLAYLFNKLKYIASLLAIKSSEKIKEDTDAAIGFGEFFLLLKGNIFVVSAFVLSNVFIIYYNPSPLLLPIPIFLSAAISFIAPKNSKVFWLFISLIFAVEVVFISNSDPFSSNALLFYTTIMVSYFVSKCYFNKPIITSIVFMVVAACLFTRDFASLLLILNFLSFRKLQFRFPLMGIMGITVILSLRDLFLNFDGAVDLILPLVQIVFFFLINLMPLNSSLRSKFVPHVFITYLTISYLLSALLFPTSIISEKKLTITIPKDTQVSIIPTQSYRPVLYAEFPVDLWKDPVNIKLGTSMYVLLKYLKITLVPYPLSFYYGYAEVNPVSLKSNYAVVSIFIHMLLLIAAALSFKRNKFIAFGIAIYLISIAPFSALVAPIPGVMGDRYLFAPSFGFAMVLGGIVMWLSKTDWHSKLAGITVFPKNAQYALGAVLLVYASLTIARNNDWKDRLTLFRNDIVNVPNSAQAHNLLAYHLNRTAQEVTDPFEQKKLMEEAVFHFQRATEIWPEFMNATYDLGRTHEQLGNWNQAITAYKRTFEIDTSFSDAIFRIGVVYEAENKLDSAIIAYLFVTEDNPTNITAFNNLSYCYFKKQEYRNAIETGRRSSIHHPTNTDPIVNIGKTFLHIKENDSALYYFEKVYPNRADDKGLTEVLYKLWNEKGNIERTAFYYRRMQIMGMVK